MHFDHSGGAHQFPKVDVHSTEANWVAKGDPKFCASWVTANEVRLIVAMTKKVLFEKVAPKPKNWRAEDYSVKPCQVAPLAFTLPDQGSPR